MSNGLNEKPAELPQPDSENKSHVHRGWITAQVLNRLAAILLSRIKTSRPLRSKHYS